MSTFYRTHTVNEFARGRWRVGGCLSDPFFRLGSNRLEDEWEVLVPLNTESRHGNVSGGREDWDYYVPMLRKMGFEFTLRESDLAPDNFERDGVPAETLEGAIIVTIPIHVGSNPRPEGTNTPAAAVTLVHLLRYFWGEMGKGYIIPALRVIRADEAGARMNPWEQVTCAWLSGPHSMCSHCMSHLSFLSLADLRRYAIDYTGDAATTHHFGRTFHSHRDTRSPERRHLIEMIGNHYFSESRWRDYSALDRRTIEARPNYIRRIGLLRTDLVRTGANAFGYKIDKKDLMEVGPYIAAWQDATAEVRR